MSSVYDVWLNRYVTPPTISYDAIYEQSTVYTPVVFILSPGSDPGSDLSKLSERLGVEPEHLKFISLGQGQEAVSNRITLTFSPSLLLTYN